MTNGAMYLEDTINRRQSRWLTLDTAAKGDAKVLAGPTNDGWVPHPGAERRGRWAGGKRQCWPSAGCSPALVTQHPPGPAPDPPLPPPHPQVNFVKLSDTTGTKLGSFVPSMWNKICILDKSGGCWGWHGCWRWLGAAAAAAAAAHATAGPRAPPLLPLPRRPTPAGTGYTLQLDTAFLYSSDSFSFSTAAAADPLAALPLRRRAVRRPPRRRGRRHRPHPLYSSTVDAFSVQGAQTVDATTGFNHAPQGGAGCRWVGAAGAAQLPPRGSCLPPSLPLPHCPAVPRHPQPNVTNEDLAAICAELATTNATSRFNGICITDEETARAQVQAALTAGR